MKAVLNELTHESWAVLIALECEDVVAFSEGMLHVQIRDTVTGLDFITKQRLKEETLDQLEGFGLIEHVPGEHLDTIRLSESGRYWLKRKEKIDTTACKKQMKRNPLVFFNRTVIPETLIHVIGERVK